MDMNIIYRTQMRCDEAERTFSFEHDTVNVPSPTNTKTTRTPPTNPPPPHTLQVNMFSDIYCVWLARTFRSQVSVRVLPICDLY